MPFQKLKNLHNQKCLKLCNRLSTTFEDVQKIFADTLIFLTFLSILKPI